METVKVRPLRERKRKRIIGKYRKHRKQLHLNFDKTETTDIVEDVISLVKRS